MVSTGYGPDESGELANTRLCVAGSNEAGSDLFYEWLDCDQAWPTTLAHMPPFWSQVTDGLAVFCIGLVG